MTLFIKASHDKETLTVKYIAIDGQILLRSGGPIAWRFNNPGNIRPKPDGNTYPGQIGVGNTKTGNFVIFASYDIGRSEKKALLRRSYNNYTLSKALDIYALKTENETEEYIDFLEKKTGIKRSTTLSSLNDSDLERLMDAMQQKEEYSNIQRPSIENWIQTTSVNVNDGAKPIVGQVINISIGEIKKKLITNNFGDLPLIPHFKIGEKIKFSTFVDGAEKTIGEVLISEKSQAINLVYSGIKYSSKLLPQNGKTNQETSKKFIYRVVTGDNILKISKRFRVGSHEIQNWNYLKNPNFIYPGQLLTIGGYAEKSTNNNKELKSYRIKKGDTASTICKKYNVSLNDFMKINSQISNKEEIKEGQIVKIPNSQNKNQNNSETTASNTALSTAVEMLNKTLDITRSKNGTGEGLAVLAINNKEAPWMAIVIRELKQWHGSKEKRITETDNYHLLSGTKLNTMVGDDQAWCASFANYCLQEAKYKKSKEPASALSFRRDKANFEKISAPIFGALATEPTSSKASLEATSGAGHVGFVYCLDRTAGRFIIIGGNQGDRISILSKKISSYRFYVPKAYYEFSKTQRLEKKMSSEQLHKVLGLKVIKNFNAKAKTKTR